jgi:hypothetical protein
MHTEFCENYSEVLCTNPRKRREGNLKMNQRCCVERLLEQVLKLCPVAGFGTNCVKPSCSVSKMLFGIVANLTNRVHISKSVREWGLNNVIWTGFVSNLCLSSERLTVNCLIRGMALKTKDPVHTSQRTHDSLSASIELMLYRGTVAFYAEYCVDHMKWLQYVGEIDSF